MTESGAESTHAVSEGGISGTHAFAGDPPMLVGPTTSREHNTLRVGIIPIACWRVEDVRFDFDSSVVRPEMQAELSHLTELVQRHPPPSRTRPDPGSPLSVFGHADPTGNDDYNKQLSGRRATAIYALLTRRTDLWERLFSSPLGNDRWGRPALETMLQFTGRPEPVAQVERDPGARRALFLAYMDQLCGPDLSLERTDFLANGDDAGGKGDFQGCSEFNPVLIVSQQEQARFDRAQDKSERNAANASNRRVMVLIFRKGSRVRPDRWPCPRVSEGVAACRKRFWSDGEKRRSTRLSDKRRQFQDKEDTFACRFYQRLLDGSPCERTIATVRVRLFDLKGQAMPKVEFFAEIRTRKERGQADDNGEFVLRDVEIPTTCLVRWSRRTTPPMPPPPQSPNLPPELRGETDSAKPASDQPVDRDRDFEFETVLQLDVPDPASPAASDDDAIARRLHNLGYPLSLNPAVRIELFKRDTRGDTRNASAAGGGVEDDVVRRHDELAPPRKA